MLKTVSKNLKVYHVCPFDMKVKEHLIVSFIPKTLVKTTKGNIIVITLQLNYFYFNEKEEAERELEKIKEVINLLNLIGIIPSIEAKLELTQKILSGEIE